MSRLTMSSLVVVALVGGAACGPITRGTGMGDGGADGGEVSPYPVLAKARAKKVQVGVGYACALTTTGTVRCWGQSSTNTAGGDGMAYHFGTPAWTKDIPEPVEVAGISNVTDIAIQYSHVCVLTSAKKVLCWGRNAEGQIGNGTVDNVLAPFELPISNVKKVAVGTDHTCVLLEDGSVKCWGSNSDDQLEDVPVTLNADRWAPLTVPYVTGATDLMVSGKTTCVTMGGQPRCWGALLPTAGGALDTDPPPRLLAVPGLTELVRTRSTACGIVGGAAKCWGDPSGGNLGTGADFGDPEQPMPANVRGLGTGVTSMSNGCATAGGKVWCWGSWPQRFGDGTNKPRSLLPVAATGLTDAVQVSNAFETTCAVTSTGAVYCWGDTHAGQAGIGMPFEDVSLTPQKVKSFE